jgi:hypothetical protein
MLAFGRVIGSNPVGEAIIPARVADCARERWPTETPK